MSIIHTADIHLGFRAYSKTDENGMNIRQADVFNRFEELIDVAINEKHTGVFISGDLFHNVRPSNGTIAFCMEQMNRLRKENINVFIIAGNHDMPRSRLGTSPLEMLKFFGNVVCCDDERISHTSDNMTVHMIPYRSDYGRLMKDIKQCKNERDNDKKNIIMLHASVGGFRMLQHDEVVLSDADINMLTRDFDYVALGHYHGHWNGGKHEYRISYPGSLEKLTFNEKDDVKGYNIIDLDSGDINIDFIELDNVREMVDIPALDLAETIDPTEDIIQAIENAGDLTDKICRLSVVNVPAIYYHSIDFRRLRKLTKDAVDFEFKFDIDEEELDFDTDDTDFKDTLEEWTDFSDGRGLTDAVKALGIEYIKDVEM